MSKFFKIIENNYPVDDENLDNDVVKDLFNDKYVKDVDIEGDTMYVRIHDDSIIKLKYVESIFEPAEEEAEDVKTVASALQGIANIPKQTRIQMAFDPAARDLDAAKKATARGARSFAEGFERRMKAALQALNAPAPTV